MTRTRTINHFEIFVLTNPGLWCKVYTLVEIVNTWGSRDRNPTSWLKPKRGIFTVTNKVCRLEPVHFQMHFLEISLSLSPSFTFFDVGWFFQFGRGGPRTMSFHTDTILAHWPPHYHPQVKRASLSWNVHQKPWGTSLWCGLRHMPAPEPVTWP